MDQIGGNIEVEDTENGVWFIYDGDCPICQMAAEALRIKQDYGTLHLLDARVSTDHPLMQEINIRGLDLDQGMVIVADGQFHFGKGALKFMARYSERKGLFNWFTTSLFWSDFLAKALYPLMRGGRNLLLKLRGVDKIRNLED